jgi:hypothetical protein
MITKIDIVKVYNIYPKFTADKILSKVGRERSFLNNICMKDQ